MVGKEKGAVEFDRLSLLPKLLPVYVEILTALIEAGAEWIQIDEPALTVDLPKEWVEAYKDVYATLSKVNAKILLSTYFGSVAEHAALLKSLPVDGLHIDLVRAPEQLDAFADYDKVLSAGVIDGAIFGAQPEQSFGNCRASASQTGRPFVDFQLLLPAAHSI